jgi:hypothetical protein
MKTSSSFAAAAVWLVLATISSGVAADPVDAPRPLDYSDPANWAARADAEGAAAIVAPGAEPRRALRQVDVFYIYPTTDLSRDHYSQDMADETVKAWTDGSVVARQAGAFNRCCRMFAPRYRQATLGGGDAALKSKAFAYAYSDVLRAFDYYLVHDNGGRPFILVGHSQGAGHLIQLLQDRIDSKPLQAKLVAAYVLGAGLAEGDFGRTFKTVKICDTPRQTGCVVQWNSILPSTDKSRFTASIQKSYIGRWGDNPGKSTVCVNPLTFDRAHPSASAGQAKGAVPGAPDASPIRPLLRGAVGARCEDGVLIVTPAANLDLQPLGPTSQMGEGSMHYHDVGLFYEDVRENADLRARSFLHRASAGCP